MSPKEKEDKMEVVKNFFKLIKNGLSYWWKQVLQLFLSAHNFNETVHHLHQRF